MYVLHAQSAMRFISTASTGVYKPKRIVAIVSYVRTYVYIYIYYKVEPKIEFPSIRNGPSVEMSLRQAFRPRAVPSSSKSCDPSPL